MKTLLKLEQLALFITSYLISLYLGYSWWLFFVLLLLPDLSMVGYAISNRVGAILYNIFHHQALGLALIVFGYVAISPAITLAGSIILGHSAMDRCFGYGLKYNKGFRFTHLGEIGHKPG